MTAPDPVRAGRALGGVAAGILVLEGIATLFVPRGIAQVEGGLSGASLAYLLGLAIVLILSSGVQRRPQGVLIGTALQMPLLLTGLLITLFLGFAKRRAEWQAAGEEGVSQRKVLEHYGPELLDHMITVAAAGVVMSYSLYTMSADTVARHGTPNLIYTVPFVLYGIFRYIYLLHHRQRGEDPAAELLLDPHLAITFLAWLVTTVWLIA